VYVHLLALTIVALLTFVSVGPASAAGESCGVVVTTQGDVSLTGGGAIEAFAELPADTGIEMSSGSSAVVIWGNRQVELRGPAKGPLGDLVDQQAPATRSDVADAPSLLTIAARSLADWLTSGEEVTRAGVRGVDDPIVPVWPASTAVAPTLFDGPFQVTVAETIRADHRIVARGNGQELELEFAGDAQQAMVPLPMFSGGAVQLDAIDAQGVASPLATWDVLSQDHAGRVAEALEQSNQLSGEGLEWVGVLLRAAALAQAGCILQALEELATLVDLPAEAAQTVERASQLWQPVTLLAEASYRPPGAETFLALTEGVQVPPGSMVRLELSVDQPIDLKLFGLDDNGGWQEIPGVDPMAVFGQKDPNIEIPFEGGAGTEGLAVWVGTGPAVGLPSAPDPPIPGWPATGTPTTTIELSDEQIVVQGFGTALASFEFQGGGVTASP